jgi:hypothetical protein
MALMTLLFGAFGLFILRLGWLSENAQVRRGAVFMIVWITLIAGLGVVSAVWFWRRIATEFSYDGRALRFRTLGSSKAQLRGLMEIVGVDDWRGRGGGLGFRIKFRDGGKIYLQFGLSQAEVLAAEIRAAILSGRR